MEFDEYIEQKLIEKSFSPERLAELVAEEADVSKEQVYDYIKDNFSLTDSPGRRSFDYCLQCNPYLNGSHGKDGTEAVAKHYIPEYDDTEQILTGWEGLCYECASQITHNSYVDLEPLPGHEDLDIFGDDNEEESATHECQDPTWTKLSLVTEEGMFDWVECDECGIQAKRYNSNNIDIIGFDAR